MKYFIIFFSAFLLIACKKEKEIISNSKPTDSTNIVQDSVKTDSTAGKILVDVFPLSPKKLKNVLAILPKTRPILKTKNTFTQTMPEKRLT